MEILIGWFFPVFTGTILSVLLASGWDTGEWRHKATFLKIEQCESVKEKGEVCVPIDDGEAGLFEKRKPIKERILGS